MKSRIFLLLILLGWSIQNKAQSDYLTPADGYLTQDLITNYMFSTFEVSNGTLYGFDIDGIHAFNAETGEHLYTESKPDGYSAQPSFMKVDASAEYLWMGFTKADLSDDRIFRFNLSNKSWEHMASLSGNFDVEFIDNHVLISGLNSSTWGDPNGIFLLDISGNNDHIKIIEPGGNSAGIATDGEGNLYYASYFMSEDNFIYKWDAADVMEVINGNSSALAISDAAILASLPAGAYDCDVDDNNNLIFNCNDFTNGGFVAIWNGTSGAGNNYTSTCATTEWLTYVKASGNVNSGSEFYTMAYAQAVAEIKAEAETNIELTNPIADHRKPKNLSNFEIDLSTVFEYEDGELNFEISNNSNTALINVNIEDAILNISSTQDQIGSSEIEITANANGQSLSDEFEIVIFDYNYEDGVFIVNEDWFGHDDGTVNFFTNEGDFVYRAYRNENPGETLGTTTQFATTFGDHIFFMSKQGNRLVVANRQTLLKEAVFTEIGGDGRAFAGVNENKAYVGTSNGIRLFDLTNLSLGDFIPGFTGETGGMLQAENYVFIINGNQVHILENDEIIESVSGSSFAGITRSMDGNVWVGAGNQLLRISPYTLENEFIDLPNGMTISGSNGAWNAGSLCASNTENSLFWSEAGGWGSSNMIYKYEIGNISSLNGVFYTLPDDWVTYGAGLRVHPVDNEIYITAKKDGWGDNSKYNKLFVVNTETANLETSAELEEYFWFPAMPLMADKYAPELTDEISLQAGMNSANIQIELLDYITDIDNLEEAIEFKITQLSNQDIINAEINDHELDITFLQDAFGNVTIELQAISNGKILSFEANVLVNSTVGVSFDKKSAISCSPNPFNNQLHIEINNNSEYEVEIFNINGQMIYKDQIVGTSYLDLSSLDKGSYLLKLISSEETYNQKVIKN